MLFAIALGLALSHTALCQSGESVVEKLLREAWQPHEVVLTWTSTGALPISIAEHDDWNLASPTPTRPCGSMIVSLERIENGTLRKVALSGSAEADVTCLTTNRAISAGETVSPKDLISTKIAWRHAYGNPLTGDQTTTFIAARALIPGRPVTDNDVKPVNLIERGQKVSLYYHSGSVSVMLAGRALDSGSIGDEIQAATDSPRRVFRGRIMENGNVEISL